jgi:hypothetical protein
MPKIAKIVPTCSHLEVNLHSLIIDGDSQIPPSAPTLPADQLAALRAQPGRSANGVPCNGYAPDQDMEVVRRARHCTTNNSLTPNGDYQ